MKHTLGRAELNQQMHNSNTQSSVKGISIRAKVIAIATIFSILPVLIVGSVAYRFTNESVARQISTEKTAEAVQLANQLKRFLQDRLVDVEVLARVTGATIAEVESHQAKDSLAQKRALKEEELEQNLTGLLRNYTVFSYFGVFDLKGNEIVRSRSSNSEKNQRQSPYFQQVLNTGLPGISDPIITNSAGYDVFSIYLAAPIKQDSGKTIAIIVAKIPTEFIGSKIFGTIGLRKESKYSMVDSSGRVFQKFNVPERNALGYKITELVARFPVVDRNRQSQAWIDKTERGEMLQSYAPMKFEPIRKKGEMNWSIVISTDAAIAFALKQQLLGTIVLGTLLATVVATVLAAMLANRAVQPLLQATVAVEKLGQGELDTRLQVQGNDELAVLAANINKMAERIQTLLGDVQASTTQIQQYNQQVVEESQVLQSDVSHLLDTVAALESGDLTVQAPISDRATGLVADTLNRLIEELARIMATVLSTAQQVTQGSTELEQLAAVTAQQAQQQVQSVNAVQASVVTFNDLSQQTAQQALVSDQAVQQAQIAVSQGQQEMGKMSEEIKILHSGMEQIVKRAQMLTGFVTSAAQFTKDQKRVATLTRVLALNASMIAARASGQQDPEQFASIAREFETIATQVNDLAVQTNQGLLLLQQQTAQIQTVVSGINQDVNEISDSVSQFVGGVEQSQHVFALIKSVTDRVAQIGQQVTTSSQAIAAEAQTTLRSIEEIATVAAKTEQQSSFTQEQAGSIDNMARSLLEKVRFFRISEADKEDKGGLSVQASR